MSENAIAMERTRPNIDLTDHAVTLVIVCLVGLVMNTVGPAMSFLTSCCDLPQKLQ